MLEDAYFPAIFPASATLVEHHELEKKAHAGIGFTLRGRLSAALDARGASMGAFALMIFALVVWKEISAHNPVLILGAAVTVWAAIAGTSWRLRRWHPNLDSVSRSEPFEVRGRKLNGSPIERADETDTS